MSAITDARPPVGEPAAGTGSLPALLAAQVRARPRAVALRHKHLGVWEQLTWADYAARVESVAAGLRALGVGAGERVAIVSENRVEWLVADLATQAIGAVSVGCYPVSPPEELAHVLADAGAVVAVAENELELDKLTAVRDRLPALRAIVVVDTRGIAHLDGERTLSLEELEVRGRDGAGRSVADLAAALDPSAPATIVYTSGSTAAPKGAMFSHGALVAAGRVAGSALPVDAKAEVIATLPLANVIERLVSLIGPLTAGYAVNVGEGPDTFVADLVEVQPTLFAATSHLWEELHAGVRTRAAGATRLKRGALRRVVEPAADGTLRHPGLLTRLLVCRPLRARFGLRRVQVAIAGSSPLAAQTRAFFRNVGVDLREAYGLTECMGLATMEPPTAPAQGTVGRALPGVEVRVDDRGEVLVRSPAIFDGYAGQPGATQAVLDADGWLRTGDLGTLDDDGLLHLADRDHDMIVTSAGVRVSPRRLEHMLVGSPMVRRAVVLGDGRPRLVALLEIEPDVVADWCAARGLRFQSYRDLTERAEVIEAIGAWVADVNAPLDPTERVERFALLPGELDHEEGHLTPTRGVRRGAVAAEFAEIIEGMYRP